MKSVTLSVKDMSCNHCVNAIDSALKVIEVDGRADLDSKTVQVNFDENEIDISVIKKAIEDQGYNVQSLLSRCL